MGSSQKRVYGKGSTASSQAVLSEQFLDENEIEQQQSVQRRRREAASPLSSSLSSALSSALSLKDDAKPPSPAPAAATPVPVSEKDRDVQKLLVSILLNVQEMSN